MLLLLGLLWEPWGRQGSGRVWQLTIVKVKAPTPPRLQSHLWLLEYKCSTLSKLIFVWFQRSGKTTGSPEPYTFPIFLLPSSLHRCPSTRLFWRKSLCQGSDFTVHLLLQNSSAVWGKVKRRQRASSVMVNWVLTLLQSLGSCWGLESMSWYGLEPGGGCGAHL